jgi:monoterpene epsilon-lactone hydrolase
MRMTSDPDTSAELSALIADLRKWSTKSPPLDVRRAAMDAAEAALALPSGITASAWQSGSTSGLLLSNAGTEGGRMILFLHGGGFVMGSPKSHRNLAAAIALAARSNALLVDYRLAPEHPFPAGLDDALAAYATLLETTGPNSIAIVGDSAGGGLAVSTTIAARMRGLRLPAALVCLSPWLDLTCPAPTERELERIDDPVISSAEMIAFSAQYRNGAPANDPLISPVFADLVNLPPTLIQVGGGEVLLRDAIKLSAAVRDTPLTLEIEPGVPHVWQWFSHRLGRARSSIDRIGVFLDRVLAER